MRSAGWTGRHCTANSPPRSRCCCTSRGTAPAVGGSAEIAVLRNVRGQVRAVTVWHADRGMTDDAGELRRLLREPEAGMNGIPWAAALSAAALVVYPSSPRRRLAPAGPRPRAGDAAGGARNRRASPHVSSLRPRVLLPLTTTLAAVVVGATASAALPSPSSTPARIGRGPNAGDAPWRYSSVNCGSARTRCAPSPSPPTKPPGAVAGSLRAVAARAGLGADVTAGLRDAARSSALPAQWDRLAVCWQLASEHGLAIATLMRAAQRDITERQRFSARVSSSMAGARATAAILAALPVLGVLLGQLIGARPLSFLLGGHAGGWLLVVGSTLACAGLLWSDRITDRLAS